MTPGRLPVNITLATVQNYLLNQARNAGTDTGTYCSLMTKLLELPYTPNKKGPGTYFKEQEILAK